MTLPADLLRELDQPTRALGFGRRLGPKPPWSAAWGYRLLLRAGTFQAKAGPLKVPQPCSCRRPAGRLCRVPSQGRTREDAPQASASSSRDFSSAACCFSLKIRSAFLLEPVGVIDPVQRRGRSYGIGHTGKFSGRQEPGLAARCILHSR